MLAWELSNWIVEGNAINLGLVGLVGAGLAFSIVLIKDWRYGIYCFLIWLIFEDLIRKFTGNGTAMFFAKDLLIGLTYVAMLLAFHRRQLPTFRAPFFLWLGIFSAVSLLQVFNPDSPSVLYGILGFKLYFYYVPLMFAGYALLRSEKDLHKILMLNMWIALIVAGLGVAQSILGFTFLNPTDIAPELQTMGHDIRFSPMTHLKVERSTSVYVSDSRFGDALILFFIIGIGTAGYLLMRTKRGRKLVFPALGTIVLAAVMCGVRHSFVAIIASGIVLVPAIVWGAPRGEQTFRIVKAIRLGLFSVAAAIVLMLMLYPEAIAARWALYGETLTPGAEHSEFSERVWVYPLDGAIRVFYRPNWALGNGLGTASLGAQYVSHIVGTRMPSLSGERYRGTHFGIRRCGTIPLGYLGWQFADIRLESRSQAQRDARYSQSDLLFFGTLDTSLFSDSSTAYSYTKIIFPMPTCG